MNVALEVFKKDIEVLRLWLLRFEESIVITNTVIPQLCLAHDNLYFEPSKKRMANFIYPIICLVCLVSLIIP